MKTRATRPEWEERWQALWEQHKVYSTPKNPKKGKYVLDMFPYPSAHGLHVGHPEGYTASDIYARYLRHKGEDVLHPMGFDSFGLPAENYAIKTGTHPAKTTAENIENMRKQIKSLGFSYDWDREVITSDPSYYKWTQWIFVKLFEAGLAYEADAPINWCPRDLTGLANEEVVNGKCERCGTQVVKKKIKQWLVKITDEKYIDRLLNDLDKLDWPENIKDMQRNWIGRSEGAEVDFQIQGTDKAVTVFTTRPDTLFGATYMVLSPEHRLVHEITSDGQKKAVEAYCTEAATKSDLERTELSKQKTGVFSGAYAINPASEKPIPIWIADYVLASYGTGAIMAVPAHDQRDYEFATKFKLPIVQVIKPPKLDVTLTPGGDASPAAFGTLGSKLETDCWTGDGTMMHSGEFDGHDSVACRKEIVEWLEKKSATKHRTCLIVHGIGGDENENWFPWLKKTLRKENFEVLIPTMPSATHPELQLWHDHLQQYNQALDEESVVIGHSLGCASALYYLQQSGKKVDTIILVAPTNPRQDWKELRTKRPDVDWDAVFAMNEEKHFDWKKIRTLAKRFIIFYSDNDPFIPEKSIAYFTKHLPSAEVHLFPGKFHFSESNGGITELPEIIPYIPTVDSLYGRARFAVNFKMRDWLFSRQRYWGEPIPIVHCDACKKDIESTPHYLHFRDQSIWDRLMSGEKTVESRALNPEEPERYFGDIKKGSVIACINTHSNEKAYFEVTKVWKFKNISDLFKHQDIVISIKGTAYSSEKELTASYNALRSGYAEQINKNGLVAWQLRHVYPGLIAVPEKELPLELPDVEKYEPTGTGESPLANIDEWVNTTCPRCGGKAKRETNTMPQWAGSNWYFLRYTDPRNKKKLASPEKIAEWMPVEMYIGGAEHAVLHLLYARFIYKFLFDIQVVPESCGDEPFQTLKNQGLILGEDMQKMSKSRGNVVNPDDVISTYGADVMRMYEMFMGPFEDAKPWSMQGMVGIKRFLEKAKTLFTEKLLTQKATTIADPQDFRWVNKTIYRVTNDIGNFKFNTAISALMEYVNYLTSKEQVVRSEFMTFLVLLSPFAPHVTEELWQKLHGRSEKEFAKENSVTTQPWPSYDESKLVADAFTLVVMINGKKRDDVEIPKTMPEQEIQQLVKSRPNVKKWIDGKKIKMEKYIPEKIYTIVVQ